jgi:hypothetical protein
LLQPELERGMNRVLDETAEANVSGKKKFLSRNDGDNNDDDDENSPWKSGGRIGVNYRRIKYGQ